MLLNYVHLVNTVKLVQSYPEVRVPWSVVEELAKHYCDVVLMGIGRNDECVYMLDDGTVFFNYSDKLTIAKLRDLKENESLHVFNMENLYISIERELYVKHYEDFIKLTDQSTGRTGHRVVTVVNGRTGKHLVNTVKDETNIMETSE